MIGDGHEDDGDIGISSQYRKTGCRDESEEGQWRGVEVVIGGCCIGGNRDLADKGVCGEVIGNHCVVCCRGGDLQTMYKQ